MALPIIMVNSLGVAMELANAFFLGRLGANALAAVTMAFAVIFFIMTIGSGLGIGTVALVSRAYGAREYGRAEHIGTQSMVMGMGVAVVIGTIGYVFAPHVLGLLGFPRMGVAGAAVSSVFARVVGSALMVRIMLRGRHAVRLSLRKLAPDFGVMKRILMVGLPGSIQMAVRSSTYLVMSGLAARLGPMVVAALGVGNRLFGVFLLPGFGFGAAVATLVGQNLGARKPERAERSALLTVFYYFLFIIVFAVPLFIFSSTVASTFSPEPDFVRFASEFIRYICVGALFLAPGMMFSQTFQGAGETVFPMVVTAITLYGVQLPVAWLLSVHLKMGAAGLWTSNVTAGAVNATIMAIAFLAGRWKGKRL